MFIYKITSPVDRFAIIKTHMLLNHWLAKQSDKPDIL